MIRLKCIKEGPKLRIKIISPGYNQQANCTFPKNIRQENREYLVPEYDVSMADTQGKFFYRIRKNNITICSDVVDLANLTIYGQDSTECCICFNVSELIILANCGHYCCCMMCALQITKCPMCRDTFVKIVTKDMLQ